MNRFWIVLLLTCTIGKSFAGPPVIESIEPAAGQRGNRFELSIRGTGLKGVGKLLFDRVGLVCESVRSADDNHLVAIFRAGTECALGEVAIRAASPQGVSPLKTFWVVPFPVLVEKRDAESAISIPNGITVSGIINASAPDRYLLKLKRGERVSVEVVGIRLGFGLTDTQLKLFDPLGKLILEIDDTPLTRQDPFLNFEASQDGEYRIEVVHATREGADDYRYLLCVGSFPRPNGVFPLGGEAGRRKELKLLDHLGKSEMISIDLTAETRESLFFLSNSAPSPIPFRISPFPDVMESAHATSGKIVSEPSVWPVAFNGTIDQAGERDVYSFKAVAGDLVRLESFAARLGALTDTVLSLRDPSGKLIASNDDDLSHDSRIVAKLLESGIYKVEVRDKRGNGGPFHNYRIEVDAPPKRMTLFQAARNRRSVEEEIVTIPRGGRILKYLGVSRDGFDDEVRMAVSGLPAGVSLEGATIPRNEYLVPVVWEASENAVTGATLVSPEPVARSDGRTISGSFEQRTVLVGGPGDTEIHTTKSARLPLCVVDASPVEVEIVPLKTALVPDSRHEMRVQVRRKSGFQGPVEISLPCLPPGVEAPTSILVPADQSEAKFLLSVSLSAQPGAWPIVAEAGPPRRGRGDRDSLSVGMNGLGTPGAMASRKRSAESASFIPVCSKLMSLETVPVLLTGSIDPVICEAGRKARVICRFDQNHRPGSRFTARLSGLPPRVASSSVQVVSDAAQVEFEIEADKTTPTGESTSLSCELVESGDGLERVYRVGRGSVIRIVGQGELRLDANGKTLSPLESLRLESGKSHTPRK
jgi:hypothetical protein